MALYLFRSSDAGAPTLSGTAGDLTNLLDKLLVDGYNSKTITITRSGSTATASCTAHGFVSKQRLLIAGADQADYNGEFRITVVDANSFTFTVANAPATPATGTITAKVAPLGWSIAYTGTNKRAYRTKAGTNQNYWRVTDDGTGSATYGRSIGYEAMTDVDTGTGPFPTAAQVTGGLYILKSSAASSTTREWYALSNGKFIYAMVRYNGASQNEVFCFGDYIPFNPADVHNTFLGAPFNSGSSQGGQVLAALANTTTCTGCYSPRIAAGTGSSIPMGIVCPTVAGGNIGQGAQIGNNYAYPIPNGGGLMIARVLVYDGDTNGALRGPRGYIPGLWNHLHIAGSFALGDTFAGATGTSLEGREFEIFRGGASDNAQITLETSDTWDL